MCCLLAGFPWGMAEVTRQGELLRESIEPHRAKKYRGSVWREAGTVRLTSSIAPVQKPCWLMKYFFNCSFEWVRQCHPATSVSVLWMLTSSSCSESLCFSLWVKEAGWCPGTHTPTLADRKRWYCLSWHLGENTGVIQKWQWLEKGLETVPFSLHCEKSQVFLMWKWF